MDYIAHELVLKNDPTADASKTQYPVATTSGKWKEQLRHIRGASGHATEFIRSLQPFVLLPEDAERDPLAALNALAIIDRHRIPLLTLAAGAGVEVRFDVTKLRGNVSLNNDWGHRFMTEGYRCEPGQGWSTSDERGVVTEQESYEQLSFRIAFNERTSLYEGWDVIETLWGIGNYIQTEIFPPLEEVLGAD
ncbi:hypothetical protein [Subtercola boreus]|uniref:hypothetical protein n=1 Tax=Subtercola boreus TaxID=120213 RepID=UPI0015592A7B|nr:hypothetical protein [Subtercola boreus]